MHSDVTHKTAQICVPRYVIWANSSFLLISFHIQRLLQGVYCGWDVVRFLSYLKTLSWEGEAIFVIMQLQSIWILYSYSMNMGVSAPYCRRNAWCKVYVTGNRASPVLTGNMISPIKGRKQVKVVRDYGAEEHSWAWETERERERERK